MFRIETEGRGTGSEYTVVQYIESSEFNYSADDVLKCPCLRWSTADEVDHSRGGIDGARR